MGSTEIHFTLTTTIVTELVTKVHCKVAITNLNRMNLGMNIKDDLTTYLVNFLMVLNDSVMNGLRVNRSKLAMSELVLAELQEKTNDKKRLAKFVETLNTLGTLATFTLFSGLKN